MPAKLALAAVSLLLPAIAAAQYTGAYARVANNGSQDAFIFITQRDSTVLVTFNLVKMTQPGLFGATQKTNIFAYGLGQIDTAKQSARVQMSSFTEGACESVLELQFGAGTLTKTGVGGTCTPSTSAPEAFVQVF